MSVTPSVTPWSLPFSLAAASGSVGAPGPNAAVAAASPADLAPTDSWDQRSLSRGARRIQDQAWIGELRQSLRLGDVVLVHGNDPFITPMDGGARYVHAAIVSGTDPLTLVEAWGPNTSGKSNVREVPFAEFVDGTRADGYKLVRPTTDPARARAAVAFARQQVGKPYDWSFGLFGPTAGSAWYCSNLVHAAYGASGAGSNPLAVRKDARRDRTLATLRDVARALQIEDPAKVSQLITMAYDSPLLVRPALAHYQVSDLVDFTRDQLLAQNPVFRPLMRSAAGRALVLDASTEIVKQFVKTGSIDPLALRGAFLGRFGRLGLRDQLAVGWAVLRGAVHVRFGALWQAKQAIKQGAVVNELVSPQDLAEGPNAASWTFGAAG